MPKACSRHSRGKHKVAALDLSGLDSLDTPGALLLCALRNENVKLTGVRPEHKALLELVCGLDLQAAAQERTVAAMARTRRRNWARVPTKHGRTRST